MAKNLKVTLLRSGINRQARQKETILRLGLRKIRGSNVIPDNEAVRGMIRSVSHLIKVEPAE